MKYFQRLKTQLLETLEMHRAGDVLRPPSLLNYVIINNRRMSYLRMGLHDRGRPLLLVHGFGGFFLDWSQIILPLAKKHQVYVVDLPGWGFSDSLTSARGLEDHLEYLEKFCQTLGFESLDYVGISYGAALGWGLSIRKNIKIEKLALLNPMPPHPLQHMKSLLYKTIFQFNRNPFVSNMANRFLNFPIYKKTVDENVYHKEKVDPSYVKLGYLMIKQPKVGHTINQFAKYAATTDWDYWLHRLPEIDTETLILKGENDHVFDQKSAEMIHKAIPGSYFRKIDESGHAMIFDRPIVVVQLLDRFLNADSRFIFS